MQKVYQKLNYFLNEICVHLQKNDSFLLDNIDILARLNNDFLDMINNYDLNNKTIQNHLTFEEVFSMARKIIKTIDPSYLSDFDNLIISGELEFNYEDKHHDSECLTIYRKNEIIKKFINVYREFNYNDVRILIHEFIHYINRKRDCSNLNCLTEFLSIYFEFYTIDYLLTKGINKEEIDYLDRIKNTEIGCKEFYHYELVLLAYIKFGNLNENSVTCLQNYFRDISKEDFEKECRILYKNLKIALEDNKEWLEEYPEDMGEILSKDFIRIDYKYILGTILAIYAYKYCEFKDIVYLNNHITEYDDKSVYDICLEIGIDFKDENFSQMLLEAVQDFMQNKQLNLK